MAITRSQQAKQMLQDGGMLVKPGFGGIRQGYRGDAAAAAGAPGTADAGPAGDPGEGPASGQDTSGDTNRENRIGNQYTSPEGRAVDRGIDNRRAIDRMRFGLRRSISPTLTERARDFLGRFGPDFVDEEDEENKGGPNVLGPLGFAASAMNPMTPQQGIGALDLNRIAYRFMADGGFLEDTDEARQAYGLGSIVKKAFKTVRKPFKAVTKTLKKVAKSPTGRLLLAVAAPYALGPAMAPYMASLSAAQQAALISGATTGITQLASGEDLDFKDIALSAALSGAAAKALPPGGAKPGVDRQAFAANRASAGRVPGIDRQAFSAARLSGSRALDPSSIAGQARVAGDQILASTMTPEKTSLFSSLADSVRNIGDSKVLQFAKDNPFLTIVGASGLAGLMTKEQEEELGETDRGPKIDIAAIRRRPFDYLAPRFGGSQFDFYDTAMAAEGGRIGYQKGSKEPVAKKVMPLLDMDGMEKDYREEGGFVPIGRMEKADDVPARLSKNEFVFTADAVRNAGDGDVDKGAEVMYNMMKNLEAGGDVSEESQGLEGARRMFQTSQRLEEVL